MKKIQIGGHRYKTSPIKGYALVDDVDFERVNKYEWCLDHGYARANVKNKIMYMHRFILKIKGKVIDHKNHDGLDNRRGNLRVCTQSLNLANQRLSVKNTSGYKGVCWNKHLKYWVTRIKILGKQTVKYSKSKEEAAKKYNKLAIKHFGEFALLNKIK